MSISPSWTIQLLGGLRAWHGIALDLHLAHGAHIAHWATQKSGALLAFLAFYADRCHSREVLAETLWPEGEREAGLHNLRQALSSLRRQLEPPGTPAGAVFLVDRASIGVNPAGITTDVAAFEAALERAARSTGPIERAQHLSDAVALYSGPLLPGYYDDWIVPEQQRLAERFLDALVALARCQEQTGDTDGALETARRAVAADPLREENHGALMRLLLATSQPQAALRQYHELERVLEADLGEEPSPETRHFLRRIEARLAQAAPAAPPEVAASPAPVRASRASRPTGTVTLLLLEAEGEALSAQHRAVLSEIFARHGGHAFKAEGSAYFVAFAGAGDGLACAVACRRAAGDEPTARIALHTGDIEPDKRGYHGPVLQRVTQLLMAAHAGQILLSEATTALLRPGVPGAALEPDVHLADLGAYRLHEGAPPERLFQAEYPDMPRRAFPPLRARAGHAHNLPPALTRFFGREAEIEVLREMLVGTTEDTESTETGETTGTQTPSVSSVPSVVIPSRLVTMTGPGGAGKTRLASEVAGRLVEHFAGAVWFVPLADLSDSRLIAGAVQEALRLPRAAGVEPLDQIAETLSAQPSLLVLDNFEQLVEGGAEIVQTLLARVPTLCCLVTSRQRLLIGGEREFVVSPLPTPEGEEEAAGSPERLSALASVRMFVDRAQALAINRRLGNQALEAMNLNNLGIVAFCQGDFASARDLCGQALAIRRGIDDPWFLSHSLGDLGNALVRLGDYAAARPLLEESLALRRALQDQWGVALVLNNLGWLTYDEDDLAAAHTFGSESLQMRREMSDLGGVADCLHLLARIAGKRHDPLTVRHDLLAQGLNIHHQTGNKGGIVHFLFDFANLASAQAQPERAARLFGAAEALHEAIGIVMPLSERAVLERAAADARAMLDEQTFAAAWAEGRALILEQAVALALEERSVNQAQWADLSACRNLAKNSSSVFRSPP